MAVMNNDTMIQHHKIDTSPLKIWANKIQINHEKYQTQNQ